MEFYYFDLISYCNFIFKYIIIFCFIRKFKIVSSYRVAATIVIVTATLSLNFFFILTIFAFKIWLFPFCVLFIK